MGEHKRYPDIPHPSALRSDEIHFNAKLTRFERKAGGHGKYEPTKEVKRLMVLHTDAVSCYGTEEAPHLPQRLPPGWFSALITQATKTNAPVGTRYYFNRETKVSVWEKSCPRCFGAGHWKSGVLQAYKRDRFFGGSKHRGRNLETDLSQVSPKKTLEI